MVTLVFVNIKAECITVKDKLRELRFPEAARFYLSGEKSLHCALNMSFGGIGFTF